jgi:pimeloyl-ACP methyl ester carboxylesterase
MDAARTHIVVGDARLEASDIAGSVERDPIVLLHSAAGSVKGWGPFPQALAGETGRRVVAYSRRGHGASSRLAQLPGADFLDVEARDVVPLVLDAFGIDRCVLFGHSDGGSIAALVAAEHPSRTCALIMLAAHFFVEDVTLKGIRAAGRQHRERGPAAALVRQHDDPEGAFRAWHDVWLSSEFQTMDLRPALRRIRCPVLAIQGENDEFGTTAQLDAVKQHVTAPHRTLLVPGGHFPHRQAAAETMTAVTRFLADLP